MSDVATVRAEAIELLALALALCPLGAYERIKASLFSEVRAIVAKHAPGMTPAERKIACTVIQLAVLERAEVLMQQRTVLTAPAQGSA